ncbi:hypothetical protein CN918_31930 [Priestia megaterium]|nr:hypothetical protein CN918_31930 [Priestia megaterium]
MFTLKINKKFGLASFFFMIFFLFLFPSKVYAFYYHALIGYKNVEDNYLSSHFNIDVLQTYPHVNIISAYASISEINKIKTDPNIAFVTFDKNSSVSFPKLSSLSSKSYASNQNAYSLIKLEEAHKAGLTGKNISVCMIDTGIDVNNDAFIQKTVTVKSFIKEPNGTMNLKDYSGHGTHVAGLLAGNSEIGMFTGVAPDAKLYVAKIFNQAAVMTDESVIAAVNWCVENNAQVINMSFGYMDEYYSNTALDYTFKNAYHAGSILVAAAGNDGETDKRLDTIRYPARSPYVLAVASTDDLGRISTFSDRGPSLYMSAPGEFMYSSYPYEFDTQDIDMGDSKNGYTYLSGTSMAAPLVSGVIAITRGKYPTLSNAKIINIVKSTSVDKGTPGRDRIYGCGIIQAYPINSALASKAPSPPQFLSYSYNKGSLTLKWKGPYDCDLYGYNVLIDGKKANNTYVKLASYTTNTITYNKSLRVSIQAVDDLGNTSTSVAITIPPLSKDIASNTTLYSQTSYAIQQRWMSNFNDSTFRSGNSVSRAEGAATFNRVINLSKIKSTAYFRDVPRTHWAYTAIAKMTNAHLMYGSSAGYFGPSKSMSRAEMAVLLQRLLKIKTISSKSTFKDVNNTKQYGYQSIVTMNYYGYLKGCSTTYFCPNKSVTRGELATILKKAGSLIKQRN